MEGVVCYGVMIPAAAAGRGAVRREHHAAQGPGDARAGGRRWSTTCAGSRARCRTRSTASSPLSTRSPYTSTAVPPITAARSSSVSPATSARAASTTRGVGRREQRDRPVRAEQQPPRPERSPARARRTAGGRRPSRPPSRPRSRGPDSLHHALGSSPNGARRSAHGDIVPSRIGGLARWSTTNRSPGIARAVSSAAGSSRARTSRS